MAQIELSLAEILTLETELNGFVNPQTNKRVTEGFLREKLNLATKYRLSKLADELAKEKQLIEKLKNDLIKEHGEEKEDGTVTIEMFEDESKTKLNPKFIEVQQRYIELLDEKKEIEYTPLSISDLENVTTENNYTVLFKLVL
jgi:hypothetical protein